MEMTGGTATEAGEYTVTVSLKDTANYAWSDGSSDLVSFTWTIGEEEISVCCVVAERTGVPVRVRPTIE